MTGTRFHRRIPGNIVIGILALATLGLHGRSLSAQQAEEEITFAKHVAPILQEKCQVCHQPNSVAPMSLLTYQDAQRYAPMIRAKVAARVMPPWNID